MTVLIYKDMSNGDTSKRSSIPVVPQLRLTRSTTPTYYASTANGFITNELWKQIIDKLVERLQLSKANQHALLLLDRHSTHMELTSCKLLVDNNIHLCTYLLIPLICFNHLMMSSLHRSNLTCAKKWSGRECTGLSLERPWMA